MGKNHTLAELEAAIIEKGKRIDAVANAHYGKDGTLQSVLVLSCYRNAFGKWDFIKWNIEGKCTSRDGSISYPELDLFK